MKRKLVIALLVAVIGASLALSSGVTNDGGEKTLFFQPDTSSPRWKSLSEDVGVWLREDERFGLRGRLYVRVDGVWRPVATDGAGDVLGTIPAK